MRNLLAILGAVVVIAVGAGWYLDWFRVHRGPAGDGKQNYSIEVNTTKIGEDIHKTGTKVQEAIEKKVHEVKENTPSPSAPTLPEMPASTSHSDTGSPYSLTSHEKGPELPVLNPDMLLPPEVKPPQNR